MADNIRDRVLALRILPPKLLETLKKKIAQKEEVAASDAAKAAAASSAANAKFNSERAAMGMGNAPPTSVQKEAQIMDLDGVSCVPSETGSTLWFFTCDDRQYPARLVNLPCPVEVMKTHDHATFYKCSDVGQILIVYEDMNALEEAEGHKDYKAEGFPSYYHSGLSPPLKRVVQRRFKAREHKSNPYSKEEVIEVMDVLQNLIAQIRPETTKVKKASKANSNVSSQDAGKEIVVVEDVEVPYEPWMTNNGKEPKGIEFEESNGLCYKHPEIWLGPGEGVVEEPEEKKEEGKKSKQKKSRSKASSSRDGDILVQDGLLESTTTSHKKGIPKKSKQEVDDVGQAAEAMKENNEEDLFDLINGGDEGFDFDEDDLNF